MTPLQKAWAIPDAAPALKLVLVGLATLQEEKLANGEDDWCFASEVQSLVRVISMQGVLQRLRMGAAFNAIEQQSVGKWQKYRIRILENEQ